MDEKLIKALEAGNREKYLKLTRDKLIALVKQEAKHGFNRALDPKSLEKGFDFEDMFFLKKFMIHNDTEWRCQILHKGTQDFAGALWLDVSFETMERLERTGNWFERDAQGNVKAL